MLALILAAALAQAGTPPEPDRCNAAGRAAQPLAGCTVWERVSNNADGDGYVDPASARRDGNAVEVTVRLLLPAPLDGRVHSFHTRFRLDCAARTARQLYITAFDAAGRRIAEGAPAGAEPRPVRPDTPYAALLARFCGR